MSGLPVSTGGDVSVPVLLFILLTSYVAYRNLHLCPFNIAEIYKECLDVFLEGLIDGGGSLKRRLLECEFKHDSYRYQSILHQVDRKTIGRILCLNPEFRNTVREITELFQEIQLVKFVGQNAAQSRRRRKMIQQRAVEENLKHAVESLSMESKSCKGEEENNHEEKKGHCSQMPRSINVWSAHSPSHRQAMTRSMSWTSTGAESDTWMRCFWEKDAARFSRPRPLSRRAVTSEEEYDYYKALSSTLGPSEDSLVVALRRFPLPKSVVGDNKCLRQNSSSLSSPSDSLHGGGCGSPTNDSFYHGVCAERDSEERMVPPSHHLAGENLSPRCVTKPIFQEDSIYKKGETDGSVYRYKDDTEDSVYRYKDDTSTSW